MIKFRFDVMAIIVYITLFNFLFYFICFREEKRKSKLQVFLSEQTLSHTETIRLAFTIRLLLD